MSMSSTLIQDLENKGKCEEMKNITSATVIYMLFCGWTENFFPLKNVILCRENKTKIGHILITQK